MKLENQVCSLEQAIRLKELGVTQRSNVFHWLNGTFGWVVTQPDFKNIGKHFHHNNEQSIASAFTVAELGMMFPVDFDKVGKYYTVKDIGRLVDDISKGYDVEGFSISANEFDTTETTLLPPMNGVWHTEAQARAAMLIYLLENNHITASEVNQRLSND